MDPTVVTVQAKYLMNPKDQGVAGVLMVTARGLKFTPHNPSVSLGMMDVDFAVIKSHTVSKETPKMKKAFMKLSTEVEDRAYLFEFQNFQEREMCRDVVANALAKQKPSSSSSIQPPSSATSSRPLTNSVQAASGKSVSGATDQLDLVEMERRLKLLQGDSALQKLHKQLVINGILSEHEFWAARKNVLDGEKAQGPKQQTGIRSAMLADVRPLTDGRTNKVTFNLTPEIIHQIFAEKPAVHRAFLMNVPSKMTELAFWTKYCRAEYLYRTKNAAAAAAEAADDEDLAVFTKEDDIVLSSSRRKIQRVDPTLDMAADSNDDYLSISGHGVVRDGMKESMESTESTRKHSIVHGINRHAAVVLDGRPLDTELTDTATVAHAVARAQQMESAEAETDTEFQKRRMERVHQMTEMDDLKGPSSSSFVPLTIQDPRKYFDSTIPTGELTKTGTITTPRSALEVVHGFKQQVSGLLISGFKDPLISPELSYKILADVTQNIVRRQHTMGTTTADHQNILDSFPHTTREEVMTHVATVNELLRHFWASYPLTSALLVQKVVRLKDAMSGIYKRIQESKEAAPSEIRHLFSQLLQPLFQALDAAFAHYDTESAKRATRPTQGLFASNTLVNGTVQVV
jgi:transcription initiation factor TFIIH subunit 1